VSATRHRGLRPGDEDLFAPSQWPRLREATADLSWLLGRGYADAAALKLVGDRLALTERQRAEVMRCACPDAGLALRRARRVPPGALAGEPLLIDGFNLLTTLEVALSGGVVLGGRDGCFRDIASVHGSYHRVEETAPSLALLGDYAASLGVPRCLFYLDAPVSNSGRLKGLLLAAAAAGGWDWRVELVPSPDALLSVAPEVVVTADRVILDRCARHANLARGLIEAQVPGANVVDLGEAG
jgi:hypothetical protein